MLMCFWCFGAHAQKSISSQAFQVNVRPVLSGILQDFYQMIVLFPDFPAEMVELINDVDSLSQEKENLLKDCPRLVEKKCLPAVDAIAKKLSNISDTAIKLLAHQRMSSSLHFNTLSGMRLIYELQTDLEQVKGKIGNISFMLKAQIMPRQETYPLIKQIDQLSTLSSLAIVEYIPFNYKEEFRHFFFNFVHPIQMQISKNMNYEFLNRNVSSLNFTINLLNMSLTKRNKKTPEGMGPYLATIHNRWNSILRNYY